MKYNQYDIEDFLADKEFIEWVKNSKNDHSLFFEKWLKTNPANINKALLAREILLSVKPRYLEPKKSEYEIVLANLMRENQNQLPIHRPQSNNYVWWRWAAIIIMVFSVSYFLNSKYSEPTQQQIPTVNYIVKTNPSGQRSQIHLPDGSMVYLNAESQLKYPENFGDSSRIIKLTGEAFFEVKKNRQVPFIVQTGMIVTQVLGTKFNVDAWDQSSTTVSLLEGEVQIAYQDNAQINTILQPGEKAIVSQEEIKLSTYNYKDIAWKDGVIMFESASLHDIKNTLQQWFGVDIQIINSPAGPWYYSGKFRNASLEVILERMSFTEKFSYKIKNDLVTIKF